MFEVEVKGFYGQLIKGYLRRIVEDKGVIVYVDDLTTEETIPLNELRLPPPEVSDTTALTTQTRVEVLLPMVIKENPQENGFLEALGNLQISLNQHQASGSPRLANPFSCLTCPSWWPCVVTKVRDAHAVVQLRPILPTTDASASLPKEYTDLAASLATMTEICERKMLRPVSAPDAPCLSLQSLHTLVYHLPQELASYAENPAVHECMLRHCGGPAALSVEDLKVTIISPSKEVIQAATLLQDTHIRMLRQKWSIIRYINQTKKGHDAALSVGLMMGASEDAESNIWCVGKEKYHIESFDVPSSLMGLVIGTQGANIRAARQLPGIVHIEVHEDLVESPPFKGSPAAAGNDSEGHGETGSHQAAHSERMAHIKIIADSATEAKAARSALEFCEMCLLVPRRLIGRILGSKTANILAINERSGVKHIHLEENPECLPKQVESIDSITDDKMPACVRVKDIHPELASTQDKDVEGGFFLCGTRDAVDKARLLITFQIDCIFDLEKLEAEKLVLLRELPPPRGGAAGYHPPHPDGAENGVNGPPAGNRSRNLMALGGPQGAYRVGTARTANSGAGDPSDGQNRGSSGNNRRGGGPRSSGDHERLVDGQSTTTITDQSEQQQQQQEGGRRAGVRGGRRGGGGNGGRQNREMVNGGGGPNESDAYGVEDSKHPPAQHNGKPPQQQQHGNRNGRSAQNRQQQQAAQAN